jgi:hypothetical protein
MVDRYYGLDRGETEFQTSEGAATTNKDVEVVIDLAKNLEKSEVLIKLDEIKNHIIKGDWPPA